MKKNQVSIIIPTYNRAHTICRAIDSVLPQVNLGDEIIVVDDGSTDNTKSVLEKYKGRIIYVKIENCGAGGARNAGVKKATKTFVTFLDSDDEWIPGKLDLQREFMMREKEVLFCFTNFGFRTKAGKERRKDLHTWHNDKRRWSDILGNPAFDLNSSGIKQEFNKIKVYKGNIYHSALIYGNYLNVNTLIVRREAAGESLRFAEDVKIYEEYECLGRMARLGDCAYIDIETVWQNAHDEPRITDADGYVRNKCQLLVIERVWGQDREFLSKNRKLYNQERDKKIENHIGGLLYKGDVARAKEEIKKLNKYPIKYIILSKLPIIVVKLIESNLRFTRKFIKKLKRKYA